VWMRCSVRNLDNFAGTRFWNFCINTLLCFLLLIHLIFTCIGRSHDKLELVRWIYLGRRGAFQSSFLVSRAYLSVCLSACTALPI
jgi:hypothetical protein